MAATLLPLHGGNPVVCRTRDVSDVGVCLDTAARYPSGTRLSMALLDPYRGSAFEVMCEVVREASGAQPALGVRLLEPPVEWQVLVSTLARTSGAIEKPSRRFRVLVVGDDQRQRGAMALYVTSGWDVLFASDDDGITEAIDNIALDAVISELDPTDERLSPLMRDVRRAQPQARRIVRGSGHAPDDLIDRFVERDAGLQALVDAVTADIRAQPHRG
jgi:hypothetical protein